MVVKQHRFWAWASVFCFLMVFIQAINTNNQEVHRMFSDSTLKKIGCFVGGVVFGTAGVKLLSVRTQKKYIQTALRLYCGQKTVL